MSGEELHGAGALRGNGGQDTLRGTDGVQANDRLDGGDGQDTCTADPLDAMASCNDVLPWPPMPTPTPSGGTSPAAPSRQLPTVAPASSAGER